MALRRSELARLFRWGPGLPELGAEIVGHLQGLLPQASPWPQPEGVVDYPPARLEPGFLRECEAIVGLPARTDLETRARCSRGLALDDLVRARLGDPGPLPDAVVEPFDHAQVQALLALCSRAGVAVVPRGGGTSVTGAVAPVRGGVVLDLAARMKAVLASSSRDGTLAAQAGIGGPALEQAANAGQRTVGHFPQSFERSTLGGWLAARSVGQLSSRYGRADQMVIGLRAATPVGDISVAPRPASAVGPDLLQLIAGSEGSLAVITEATVRVLPWFPRRRFGAYLAPGFEAGLEMVRRLSQDGLPPATVRLSDESETTRIFKSAHLPAAIRRALDWVARRRGAALLIVVADGPPDLVSLVRRRTRSAALATRAIPLGGGAAREWWRTRFSQPGIRDALLERGILVDTLETAASWSAIGDLHGAVRAALATVGADVGAHISHVYPEGCSIYFTYMMSAPPAEALRAIERARRLVAGAFVSHGCPLSHHHGAGRLLASFVPDQVGAPAMSALRALKRELDPHGVLNPGLPIG